MATKLHRVNYVASRPAESPQRRHCPALHTHAELRDARLL